ncbi:H(+)/Cl(-) exchange transporter 7 [Halyomorpha halys]|uniref:H(+)/Cl(-) exchange transporter 7 n=1 Tax=Halyomorpha halys TaxID=286706 RepID=UPI0006D50CF6|nr:H(+)/Cl(-) exchange transporter 7-like [Halyomorpha halys]
MEQNEQEPLIKDPSGSLTYRTEEVGPTNDERNPESSSWPPRKQIRKTETFAVGSLDILSAKYESLNYEVCENHLFLEEERKKGYSFLIRKNLARWFIFLLIGVCTAFIGVIIDIAIDVLSHMKYGYIKAYIDHCLTEDCLYVPYLVWLGFNVGIVSIGSFLVAFVEPVAAGSGIPQVKCYLNGVNMPRLVRIKTLLVKVVGVISTVAGGLAGGKEGPMIHTGAIVAAGISQGKSTSLQKDFGFFYYFREDYEKRDFVSGGAAAGVAAAFGAPVGGVLFSLEEGSSFWNQSLTWRIFFASSVCTFTLNILLSTYHGHPGELTFYGLLNFGHFETLNYELFELLLYCFMGVIGGLLGSLYTYVNYKLTVFRMRYIKARMLKVMEACLVAAVSATVALLMIYTLNDCKPLGQDPTEYPVQMYCRDNEYNAIAALWIQVPEASVRSLFHDPPASHNPWTLLLFMVVYFGLSIWTYGLSVSAGIFIPTLLTGAAWGRVIGIFIGYIYPNATWVDPGKYALIGAAAQLGGVVRMTISLTIILIEATGNITFGLPLMITLMTAKWVGEYFCEGFYDIHIQLQGVPLLAWEPPPLSSNLFASEVMSYPVVVLPTIVRVSKLVDVLSSETYCGFPVVDTVTTESSSSQHRVMESGGRLRGLILRSQLLILLKNKLYIETEESWGNRAMGSNLFRDHYPRYPSIKDIYIPEEEMHFTIDLRPYMNPSPYTAQHVASLPRIFRLFRALGLRHLIIVNDTNEVIGMVTRKDLARYRVWKHHGNMGLEELKMSDKI